MQVVHIEDHEDGGATITIDCEREELIEFAKVGILKILTDVANEVIKKQNDRIPVE